jgi:4-alpha-glucanotransferase
LRTAFDRFYANRLDHFIGFVRFYELSAQDQTAVNGSYQLGPGASFFEAIRKDLGLLPLIADDLGVRTPEVEALMKQFQIPGTHVLQFEFGSSLENNLEFPKQHPIKSVVYTGTHDNDTTKGWYQNLPGQQQNILQKRLGVNNQEIVLGMIREAFASMADTAIIPAQDLLDLSTEARMNFPGVAQGNWQWRLKDGQLSQQLAQRLKSITLSSGRL